MAKIADDSDVNPFLFNSKIDVVQFHKKTRSSSDPVGLPTDAQLYYKEQTEVFITQVQKGTTLYDVPYDDYFFFNSFSSCTRDLIHYIRLRLKENKDHIKLDRKSVRNCTNMCSSSYYKAITQLTKKCYTAKKGKGEYWINPTYIFKGNRIKYFQEKSPDSINISFTKAI